MKYIEVSCPTHPNARANGCVFEHTIVAEKTLGRFLGNGEVVHHIDECKSNNTPMNLMVFATQADHARYHSGFYTSLNETENGSWVCTEKYRYCDVCNNPMTVYEGSNFCSNECRSFSERTCDRPSSDELNDMLIEHSFLAVGKMFGVSDNAIRKWCKAYGMSTKAKDYK